MKLLSTKTLILSGALLALSLPSHAVVLKQKWQAGQKLVYNLDLDGTVNVQTPADAPVLWAGIPLEVQMRGKGTAALNTLKVDEFGTGTVTVAVPNWKLDAQALGQKGQWTLQDGKSQVTLNGRAIALGQGPLPASVTQNAILISTSGQFKGIEKIGDAPKAADQTPVSPEKAIDGPALAAATFMRAFPALWPSRDVKTGDTWQANIDFPALARPAQGTQAAKTLGAFDLKLEGEDIVGGKTLHRVKIKGDIDVDGQQLDRLAPPPAPGVAPAKPGPRLDHATQTVEGTLWLDAQKGQVARAELILGGRAQTSTKTAGGQSGAPSWMDFTGTLNMALQES